jgi:hypothetical protein
LQQGIVNGYVGEIITQKDVATTLVKRLFDSILEREPTAEEIDTWVQDLLAWGSSPPGTASGIMGGQNLGATTLDFVKRIMANTLNSIPSLSIVQQWASAIDSGGLYAKEDFVVALALSDDHIAAGDSPTLTSAVTYTLPDNTFLNLTLTGTDAIRSLYPIGIPQALRRCRRSKRPAVGRLILGLLSSCRRWRLTLPITQDSILHR